MTQESAGAPGGDPRYHVVVVGAGIAGLAAAYAVLEHQPAIDVTVLEAGPEAGGKLRAGEIAGQRVDLGAEAMLNRRPEAVALARQVGLGDSLVYPTTTSAGIWTRGAVRPLPRTVMGVPADVAGLAASGIVDDEAVPRARRGAPDASAGRPDDRRVCRQPGRGTPGRRGPGPAGRADARRRLRRAGRPAVVARDCPAAGRLRSRSVAACWRRRRRWPGPRRETAPDHPASRSSPDSPGEWPGSPRRPRLRSARPAVS